MSQYYEGRVSKESAVGGPKDTKFSAYGGGQPGRQEPPPQAGASRWGQKPPDRLQFPPPGQGYGGHTKQNIPASKRGADPKEQSLSAEQVINWFS